MIIKLLRNYTEIKIKKNHFICVNTYYGNNDTNISTTLSTTHTMSCTKDGTAYTKTYIYLNDTFFEAEKFVNINNNHKSSILLTIIH